MSDTASESPQMTPRISTTIEGPKAIPFVPAKSSIPAGIKGFRVQFTLPVDNPVDKVTMDVKNRFLHFEVPINHPDLHNLDLCKLIRQCRF